MLARRGVVGLSTHEPLTTVCPWTPTSVLIMHSDGVSSHWAWKEYQDLAREPGDFIARRLLSTLGKDEDDATVLAPPRVTSSRTPRPPSFCKVTVFHKGKGHKPDFAPACQSARTRTPLPAHEISLHGRRDPDQPA